MPEMPEVEIIRRDLTEKLRGRRVVDAKILLPRLIKWPEPSSFEALVIGQTIEEVERRGKYLLLCLEREACVVIHLRMTGRLCYVPAGQEKDPYTRIIFSLDNGDFLVYADTRTLGTLYGVARAELWRISGLNNMGPEPLSGGFTASYLQKALAASKVKIKSFLLNQKYIGGLGNIYVDESLYLAGIHPRRQALGVSMEEAARLHAAVNQVIADGIADGGTTFRDYRNGSGGKGSHQENLFVYGRGGLPCRKCGTFIEKITIGGRGTHFCPQCQRLEE